MAFPDLSIAAELDAVNQILSSVGQAPVTTIDQTNPDVAVAYDTLLQCNREVQAEGWTFNTENEYPFTPDNDGNISIPTNVLSLDLSDLYENAGIDVVQRDGRLYNKITHTYTWENQVKCDVVWLFEFKDCPIPAREYITARAAVQASTKMTGDSTVYQMLQAKEAMARANLLEYECNQGDYTIFGFPRSGTFYLNYKPYKTLAR